MTTKTPTRRRVGYMLKGSAYEALERMFEDTRKENDRITMTEIVEQSIINEASRRGV